MKVQLVQVNSAGPASAREQIAAITDYGHDVLFGSFLTPAAAEPDRVVELAQLSEQPDLTWSTEPSSRFGFFAGQV